MHDARLPLAFRTLRFHPFPQEQSGAAWMSRHLARLGLAIIGSVCLMAASAPAIDWTHGTALNAEPRLPAGFAHFPYVNPDAPKTGIVRQASLGSFDSFNDQITKGEAAPGLLLTYETLMTPSLDETDISTSYGLLAEAIKYPDDFSSVSFRLNANAKWNDGQPVTVEDVIWSLTTLKEINPQYGFYFANVVKGEKTGEREVTFTFSEKGNRELPHIMGQLPVFPKHWWEGKDAAGKQRNIAEPTLEPPLGSGPYKIGKFESGRFVEYDLVENYWGKTVNTLRRRTGDDGSIQGRRVRLPVRALVKKLGDRLRRASGHRQGLHHQGGVPEQG
jgi:ABC-type oligopeptide transport system substrate-binding subunit